MMNVVASHDSPRLSTSLYNKGMDKYKAKPSDDPDYKINKPDELTRREQMLLLVHQYTFVGAPHIWNGDEVGMWGADDPDCRKPVVWEDIAYEDEKANYDPSKSRPVDVVKPDTALLTFYRKLITMRKGNPVLVYGSMEFIIADDSKMVLAYKRKSDMDEVIIVFNRSMERQSVNIEAKSGDLYRDIMPGTGKSFAARDPGLEVALEPLGFIVLKKF